MLTRRELISAGIGSTLAGILSFPGSKQTSSAKRPKNVIFCVSDGMSLQTLSICNEFQRRVYGHQSYWASLLDQPYARNCLQVTGSLTGVVTDSSAASSSWGSGVHIWNGAVNMLPDGTPLRTLTSLVSGEGAKCGLVTTTTITHATPAGFAVACKSRGSEEKIAELYLDAGVDVLMGGGDKFFSASDRDDKKDMYQVFRDQGFPVVKTRAEMLRSRDEKILGVFSHSHTPYTIDRNNDSGLAHVPSLAETARLALDKLKGNPNGFLLQIEGGKVDHAAHGNDAGTMLYEQIAFEEAVKEAVEFALEDGETLVIITADHATGGASLNGAGSGYFDSTAGLESFAKMKGSFGRVIDSWGKKPTIKSIQDGTEHLLSIQLSKEEADVILSAIDEKYRFGDSIFYRNLNGTMGMVFANHTKVGFTSGNHTSDHVMLTAIGPGSEALHGVIENISLFDTICSVWGIKYKNPTMSREDAIKIERDEKRQAERELIALNADDPFHM